jgi:predicted polyphosphate/ATP-dependent NAD kinase
MRIGLIVNPVAGMGGKVGLKGTDGVTEKALAKGASPMAPQRATEFLHQLKTDLKNFELVCAPATMGSDEAKTAEIQHQTLALKIGAQTTAADTEKAAQQLAAEGVDLIVFVGGDGTARNILDALKGQQVPVLGVPSGVKMYSGIFAINPQDAAEAVAAYAQGRAELADFEIMDADEGAIRNDVFDVKLYGMLRGVMVPALIQGSKEVSPTTVGEKESQVAIAKYVVEELPKEATLILGPGTTVERIAEELGIKKTILGVDIYQNGKATLDVDEKTLLSAIQDWKKTWLILSPIGHQGMLLGRGNQQISPEVIKRVGKKHIVVVATLNKLQGIDAHALRVDTGDEEANNLLRGDTIIVIGYKQGVTVPIH